MPCRDIRVGRVYFPLQFRRRHILGVPLVPLFGHDPIRERLLEADVRGSLPASLLLHGPRGVGKQRLALWLGQALLCEQPARPCGRCQHCRFADALAHPDLHWYFPRPRPRDTDPSLQQVAADFADVLAERSANGGLYPPPSGSDGIFVATIRALVQQSSYSPALARRKFFLIGDADRMVPQEGTEQAANALLKLLEEPHANTVIVLTSSEPGALLPTLRSRVAAVRVPLVAERAVTEFVRHPLVAAILDKAGLPSAIDHRVELAAGAPGSLLAAEERAQATAAAKRLVDAALSGDRAATLRASFAQGSVGARGAFSETLDSLTILLHARARDAIRRGDPRVADGASRAIAAVERAKALAAGNVSPQLLTATLLRELSGVLR